MKMSQAEKIADEIEAKAKPPAVRDLLRETALPILQGLLSSGNYDKNKSKTTSGAVDEALTIALEFLDKTQ